MSYILDALKKSEQERERERGSIPSIASMHAVDVSEEHKSTTTAWLYVVAVLILLGGGVFAYFYLYSFQGSPVSVAQAPVLTENTAVDGDVLANLPAIPKSVPQINKVQPTPAPLPKTDNKTVSATQTNQFDQQKPAPKVVFSKQHLQADGSVPVVSERAADNVASEPRVKKDVVLLISQLPDAVRKQIPAISFAGHVYSSTRKRSSVMINDRKMREGESVNAELTLVAITPTGAEFKFQGYTFILNALQDWSY